MATSLKPSEKGGEMAIYNPIKYLPYGKNLVKICPVDPQIALLKGFKKRKRN